MAIVGFGNLNIEQRLIADQFISIFENGTTDIHYNYAENINDGRGITAGRAGFTSGTGDILIVIEKYTHIKPNNSLSIYIDELKRLEIIYASNGYESSDESAVTDNLQGLEKAWANNAVFEEFKKVQDTVVDELYYLPALEESRKLGLKMPLSLLSLYDANIQHGESGLKDLIFKANQLTQNTPKYGADELTWLRNFNSNRKNVLESDSEAWGNSVNRVIELLDLINANNTQLAPFELRIEYPEHPDWSEDVYNLPT